MKVKKTVVSALAFPLVAEGFVGREARRWVRTSYRHYINRRGYGFGDIHWALKHGFTPEQLTNFELDRNTYQDTISAKDYAYLRPINGTYSKWLADKITINNVFRNYRANLKEIYYQFYRRDGETMIIPISDKVKGDTIDDVVSFIKEKGPFLLSATNGNYSKKISYVDGSFIYGEEVCTEESIREFFASIKRSVVLEEYLHVPDEFLGARVNLVLYNEQGDNPVIGEATLSFQEVGKIIKGDGVHDLRVSELEVVTDEETPNDTEGESESKHAAGVNYEDAKIQDDAIQEKEFGDNVEGNVLGEEQDNEEELTDSGSGETVICKIYAPIDIETGRVEQGYHIVDFRKEAVDTNPNSNLPIPQQIPYWDEIKELMYRMCKFVPQLEYFGVCITITKDGFKMAKFQNHPPYPSVRAFNKNLSDYLKRKVEQKRESYRGAGVKFARGWKKIKLKVRATYAKTFFPKGLVPYLSIKLFQDFKKDFLTNKDTSFREKMWAYKYGFLSYRLRQYDITPENRLNYISDFEYRWLRHINNKYRHWMEDKITVKYICADYNDCFPGYYFHISLKNGNNKVVPMMDCPEGYTNTYEDIFRLVREKGCLALKPDEGSHGDGFYKFSYENGEYYLNHEPATEQQVLDILTDVNNQYLVTEYIDMHPQIKEIYAGAVNTIRMIVFKKDGKTPVIGNAYMRFGSKRTGAVDNMGAGGMFARIDIESGRFYDAKIIEANEIKPCLHHPDTGVKIEGILPNWEKVKQQVLDVATSIPQLEYFGFDLALTADGIKFPEINRFPDYPAIEKYTPETIDYLLYKLEQKKKSHGYDVSRGHTLIKLPRR